MNFFARQSIAFNNDKARSCGALLGIVQGILADGELNDTEVHYLRSWLENNPTVGLEWPGNALVAAIDRALSDNHLSADEREHLIDVLQRLIGGTLEELAESTHVTELALDEVEAVTFEQRTFCLTGEFCFGTRAQCERAIQERGGLVTRSITKKLHYLVVGGLGSVEWKHGSFGTKIHKAMQYKLEGLPILIVHEDPFAAALMLGRTT